VYKRQTFDEALEGLIRVSVVATGIDRVEGAAEMQRPLVTSPRPAARPAASAAQPAARPSAQEPATARDPLAETILSAEAELERELDIATQNEMAAKPQTTAAQPGFQPQSRIFANSGEAPAPVAAPHPAMTAPRPAAPAPQPVQAAPVLRTEAAPSRMPRVEDFPPVVQAEIEHRAAPHGHADERGPMGLLKRISSSLGRREEEYTSQATQSGQAPQERRPLSAEASVYAPRRGQLDDQGRVTPQTRASIEDEQLEIPAFLRRQAK